jgi:hypothetical protein
VVDRLRGQLRVGAGRAERPTAAVIDSQSVKAADTVGAATSGFDGGKKIKGRKRHVVVDSNGWLLAVLVTAASVQDRDGAHRLLALLRERFSAITLVAQLTKRLVESALEGELTDHLGYDRHDGAGRDGRNGHRSKTVLTEVGPVAIDVPRDRDGSFEPKIVGKRKRRLSRHCPAIICALRRGSVLLAVSVAAASVNLGVSVEAGAAARNVGPVAAHAAGLQCTGAALAVGLVSVLVLHVAATFWVRRSLAHRLEHEWAAVESPARDVDDG